MNVKDKIEKYKKRYYFFKKVFFNAIFLLVIGLSNNSFSQCYNNYIEDISPTDSWQTTGSYGSMPYWSFTGYAGAT